MSLLTGSALGHLAAEIPHVIAFYHLCVFESFLNSINVFVQLSHNAFFESAQGDPLRNDQANSPKRVPISVARLWTSVPSWVPPIAEQNSLVEEFLRPHICRPLHFLTVHFLTVGMEHPLRLLCVTAIVFRLDCGVRNASNTLENGNQHFDT